MEITVILSLSLSRIFGKNSVKITVLLNKLLKSWFDEKKNWWERISRFFHSVETQLTSANSVELWHNFSGGGGGTFLKMLILFRFWAFLTSIGLDGQNKAKLTWRAFFGLRYTYGAPILLRYSRKAKLLSKWNMSTCYPRVIVKPLGSSRLAGDLEFHVAIWNRWNTP